MHVPSGVHNFISRCRLIRCPRSGMLPIGYIVVAVFVAVMLGYLTYALLRIEQF